MTLHIGFVSTFAPTNCGIATFTDSLSGAMAMDSSCSTSVIRLVESEKEVELAIPGVVSTIVAGDSASISRSAATLNSMDIALIQHEFGIYGGEDGQEVLELLAQVSVPVIVVLHTVLSTPSWCQRSITRALCERAAAIVVMSRIARDRLIADGAIDGSKIFVIHHGSRRILTHSFRSENQRPTILTWGLISPGKGIEWAIRAMDQLRDIKPAPLYVIAGRTHPKVLELEGDLYREGLQKLINELSLEHMVEFRPQFLASDALDGLIASASLVILPYDNSEQVTSGVLVEAVSAGRPIIATKFPHAVELLEEGAGRLVPFRDSQAIGDAMREILTDPEVASEMSHKTRVIARGIQWPVVGRQYLQLAGALFSRRVSA